MSPDVPVYGLAGAVVCVALAILAVWSTLRSRRLDREARERNNLAAGIRDEERQASLAELLDGDTEVADRRKAVTAALAEALLHPPRAIVWIGNKPVCEVCANARRDGGRVCVLCEPVLGSGLASGAAS